MKIKIFNRGKGWYISAVNYRDAQDKCFVNVHFTDGEPIFEPKDGWQMLDIDVLEGKFNCYKGKVGFTIFKYSPLTLEKDENRQYLDSLKGTSYEKKFGNVVDDSDLPF